MQTLESLRRGDLAGARRLDLPDAGLTELPEEIRSLAGSLELLNLSGNRLTGLPDWLSECQQLKIVFASSNPVTSLPPVLGSLPRLEVVGLRACGMREVPAEALPRSLRSLVLTDNAIGQLPGLIGELPALQKLMMTGNRLTSLPESLAGAHRLELLRLASNPLAVLPGWLASLPRLAWLAVAGTKAMSVETVQHAALPQVPWELLAQNEWLGQGASGHIHRVSLLADVGGVGRAGDSLAMKQFKGPMTSDGRPGDEVLAHQACGAHPHLLSACASVSDVPDGDSGRETEAEMESEALGSGCDSMLMPLLGPEMKPLAGPPSLSSCTRDQYGDASQGMALASALTLLRHVGGGLAHLHARGLLHGDFYAHNVLWNPANGVAWLSDLGAAACLPASIEGGRSAWQALDVCAFGILVDEVLALVGAPEIEPLGELAAACQQADVSARPSMDEVLMRLERIGMD